MNRSNHTSPVSVPKVLLTDTGRWATPARLAIALSKAGAEVAICCPKRHPALKTKALRERRHFDSLAPLDSLQSAIEATAPSVVIPCDDRSVQLLHDLYSRAEAQGKRHITDVITRSLGAKGGFYAASSRYGSLQVAKEEGIPVPATYEIKSLEELATLLRSQRFPWVMKVDGTSGGQGVKFVQTTEEAQSFYREAKRWFRTARILKRLIVNRDSFLLHPWIKGVQPDVIAQAYIQGRPANCGVLCHEGKILAGIAVEVVSAQGATGQASVVRVVDSPAMMGAAERLASRLGMSGFFGLDFVLEEGTGTPYLIEMNPRSTPLTHLQLGRGRDMIESLMALLAGRAPADIPPVTQLDTIAYFPQAWISNSEFLQSSFQDIPWEEPELTQELMRPWPNRSSVYMVYQFLWTRLFQPDSPAEQ